MVRPMNRRRVSTHASKIASGRLSATLRVATLKLKESASLSFALSHILKGLQGAWAALAKQYTVLRLYPKDLINALFPRRGIGRSVTEPAGQGSRWGIDRQFGYSGFAFLFRRAALFAAVLERPSRHRYLTIDLAAAAVRSGAAVSPVANGAQLSKDLDGRGFAVGGLFAAPERENRFTAASELQGSVAPRAGDDLWQSQHRAGGPILGRAGRCKADRAALVSAILLIHDRLGIRRHPSCAAALAMAAGDPFHQRLSCG